MTEPDIDVAARLARRYPKPRWGPRAGAAVAVVCAAILVAWVAWAGTHSANPPVAASVVTFNIASDTQAMARITVDRPDPAVAGTCHIVAQAATFERVGELTLDVPPGSQVLMSIDVTVKTFRRATTVFVDGCAARP
ncbi:MAG: DUF4307 domain-containing protein [Propionibacteriaceae bacterium]|nr:DUF4307 domain-containing protein [Micropruina sp.]